MNKLINNFEFIKIKSGEYSIGYSKESLYHNSYNREHKVKIESDYYIMSVPVTVGFYKEFLIDSKYCSEYNIEVWNGESWIDGESFHHYNNKEDYPVVGVSYTDALNFISWLNKKNKDFTFDLPTEAEFEIAAKGEEICNGTEECIYALELKNKSLTRDFRKTGEIRAVKKGTRNNLGIYDMNGLVWQWCKDWYAPYPEGCVVDNGGPESEPENVYWEEMSIQGGRVIRGGSFSYPHYHSSCCNRHVSYPKDRNNNLGFRILLRDMK